jgi:hypothetical protein
MQVGELGHRQGASLAPGARVIQRKCINSLSTGRLLLAVAWAACVGAGGGCAGGDPGPPPTGDRVLAAQPTKIQIRPGQTGTARFVLTSGGIPIAGQDVTFSIPDDPTTPFVDAQGAMLLAASAVTDVHGVASVDVTVDQPTVFRIHATAGSATFDLVVIVAVGTGNVVVAPFFVPNSSAAARALSIDVRLLDDRRCADLNLFDPPYPPRGEVASLPPSSGSARFELVSTAESSAIVGRALDGKVPIAVGCVDLLGSSLLVGGVVEVSLPLQDAVPSPVGRFALTSPLDFAPPLAAAAAIAGPWRDLGDCPLDPAQLLLDCIVDALSPATAADPLDCRPSPVAGGEGALGAALTARRGLPIDDPTGGVTACRGAAVSKDGPPSLDGIVMGLFGSPTPPLLIALPAIGDDAAHTLDHFTLASTLVVQSAGRPGEYVVTHTLDGARFDSSVMENAEVRLAPLALPVMTAYTTATTRDRMLIVANHGFSLRLGRVARAGFGAAALAPRGVSPPDAGGLIAALAALARSSEQGVTGCAALDRALCAAVGAAAGCLAAACPAGLAALTARLDGAFDAADGTGLDLFLAGSAPLIDPRGGGYAKQLGLFDDDPAVEDDPTTIATWSVDLRTASGRARQITRFAGLRTTP